MLVHLTPPSQGVADPTGTATRGAQRARGGERLAARWAAGEPRAEALGDVRTRGFDGVGHGKAFEVLRELLRQRAGSGVVGGGVGPGIPRIQDRIGDARHGRGHGQLERRDSLRGDAVETYNCLFLKDRHLICLAKEN